MPAIRQLGSHPALSRPAGKRLAQTPLKLSRQIVGEGVTHRHDCPSITCHVNDHSRASMTIE